MNKKGFTVIELMAVLVVLGLVVSITVYSISSLFKSTKEKTEDVFVGTITDALDMYLASDAKDEIGWKSCNNKIHKPTLGDRDIQYLTVSFEDIIDSGSLTQDDLINPANKEKCEDVSNIVVNIYKDMDRVYYYEVDNSEFGCLINNGIISNLPEGFKCK